MKRLSRAGFFSAVGFALLCLAAAEPTTVSPDENPNEVRPTGRTTQAALEAKSPATSEIRRKARAQLRGRNGRIARR